MSRIRVSHHCLRVAVSLVTLQIVLASLVTHDAIAQDAAKQTPTAKDSASAWTFKEHAQPMLKKLCFRCHNVDNMESGIRVDQLDGSFPDTRLFHWRDILKQVEAEAMPPEDELQPTQQQRTKFAAWIRQSMQDARKRHRAKNGSVRRLTVSQYRNSLRDLLGINEDFTGVLPPDGISKDGFANNGQTLLLSPLLVESYFSIAEKALDASIVDVNSKPAIQNFRMELGQSINKQPFPERLILGALNRLLPNQDFVVSEMNPKKPFPYEPFRMRTKYEFIEGYQGNATVRGWRKYDSIYHSVFACMRGLDGYPIGHAYQTVSQGLLLRPAIPSAEMWQVESTYGPRANFKISLRELPHHGNFRVTVKAAKYDDGLLLPRKSPFQPNAPEQSITIKAANSPQTIQVAKAGIYQADVYLNTDALAAVRPDRKLVPVVKEKRQNLVLSLNDRNFSSLLSQPAFLVARLPAGALKIEAKYAGKTPLNRIVLTRLKEDTELAKRFKIFERRQPHVGVHVGLRRDCGSTLAQVGRPQVVTSTKFQDYVFSGAINNFPAPSVEKNNVNYLAGVREIGIRSEYTDGRDMPRLLIRSIEFEGPFYEAWPPKTHSRIFIESAHKSDPPAYAREIIRSFATRAFRRPITNEEEDSLVAIWHGSFAETQNFQQSVKDALLVALTAPQFLFLVENSNSPAPEPLDAHELASKLSYFLWNTAPDERLLKLAATNKVRASQSTELARMINDPRFEDFVQEFASQWLSLDKFDVVEMDRRRYPTLTRDTRTQLRNEPIRTLEYLIKHNMPLRHLMQADYILANEVVASYYGLGALSETGFEFKPIKHANANLGGLLSQASILAGLSDGRESNPVKRGAWLARKIVAEPPDDPPPNVPALEESQKKLTLRQKLERHRNQKGCAKCHAGIDPWGIPFETFDAGGLFKSNAKVDASSTLPDKTQVADLKELKKYLSTDRIDRVAFSFMKHIATYATGRSLTYNEIMYLEERGIELKSREYRMRDMIEFVLASDLFQTK